MHTKSLTQPVEFVSEADPAVLKEHSDYDAEKYWESLFDPKYRPVDDTKSPARFKLAPLPRKSQMRIAKLQGTDLYHEAVACGLVAVSGWTHNGVPVNVGADDRHTVNGEKRLKDDWLDAHYGAGLFAELGGAVARISGLHPTSG